MFDFVVETPQNRNINRNSNRIIQKRATQAGARTRLDKKHDKPINQIADADTTTAQIGHSRSESVSENVLLSNAKLTTCYDSPFLARFGGHGQVLYLRDSKPSLPTGCFRLTDPTLSIFQRQLLATLSSQTVGRDAAQLFKVMNLTQKQFLSHLPSHYGHLPFLDEAMECLIAKLHNTVPLLSSHDHTMPGHGSPTALYGKALTSLRSAIDHNLTQNLTYIWYAVMLLTLFELLSFGNEPGWIWHAAGAARMLYKLGPKNMNSEFHISLLSSQCRIMVIDTIFSNKPCYLADHQWQIAIYGTILDSDDFGERSRTSTELWALGARIPNLFQSVSNHVHGQGTSESISPSQMLQLLLVDMSMWRNKWRDVLENTFRNVLREDYIRHQSLMVLLEFNMLTIIVNRLRCAISPKSATRIEHETLTACASIFDLRTDLMACRFRARNNGSIHAKVADGTQQTAIRWREGIENAELGSPIQAEAFDEWCGLIGRTPERYSPHPVLSPGPAPRV